MIGPASGWVLEYGIDPDRTIMSYQLRQLSGRSVILNSPDSALASFRAIKVRSAQSLEFEVTVIDNEGGVAAVKVIITITP